MHTLRIYTVVKNHNYDKDRDKFNDMRARYETSVPEFIDRDVTIVTLDEEQWKKVQKAIVEALK